MELEMCPYVTDAPPLSKNVKDVITLLLLYESSNITPGTQLHTC